MPEAEFFTRSDGILIELLPIPNCKICSKPLSDDYDDHGICYECGQKIKLEEPIYFKEVRAAGLYRVKSRENVLSKEIYEFKYNRALASKLGECLVYVVIKKYPHLKNMDLITSVPPGVRERGYNQAGLLAEYVGDAFDIPVDNELLKTSKDYEPQHRTDTAEKRKLDKGTIICTKKLQTKRILLIDDTYVTGSTFNKCSKALLESGAVEVRGLVVGRAVDKIHLDYIGYGYVRG